MQLAQGLEPDAVRAFVPRQATVDAMRKRGFFETGLKPGYPDDADCAHVTSAFGVSTRSDGSRRSGRFYQGYHGGMDIPAAEGTPLLAMADGKVVHLRRSGGIGGLAIVLQHAPSNTGLTVWSYTEYKHIQELPDLSLGQRVRRGAEIARVGNTGTRGRHYGPAGFAHLHLTAFFSQTDKYEIRRMLIPVRGQWMDLLAFFAGSAVDSFTLRNLPDGQKVVPIAYMSTDGVIVPSGATVIWPLACTPK